MNKVYLNMKSLIEKKYYQDKETVMTYLDMFLIANKVTQEEYMELGQLAADKYPEPLIAAGADIGKAASSSSRWSLGNFFGGSRQREKA